MAQTIKNWEKTLEQPMAANTGASADTVAAKAVTGNTGSNKSTKVTGITQSYYTTPTTSENYESGAPVYKQGQAVTNAYNAMQSHQGNKPGAYKSNWNSQIQSLINQALNRPDFNYDFTEDPIYNMYADKYQQQGQMAMKGAMGESAALTGGYGNSYAQQVGQQTYQGYMQNLNDIIPTLREQAYQKYQDDAERDYQNLTMLQTEDDRDYSKYRDKVTDWQNELNFLYTKYSDMSQQEYNRYINDRDAWEADRAYWYQKAYDEQQQENWEREFDARYGGSGGSSSGGGSQSKGITVLSDGRKTQTTVEQKNRGDRTNSAYWSSRR